MEWARACVDGFPFVLCFCVLGLRLWLCLAFFSPAYLLALLGCGFWVLVLGFGLCFWSFDALLGVRVGWGLGLDLGLGLLSMDVSSFLYLAFLTYCLACRVGGLASMSGGWSFCPPLFHSFAFHPRCTPWILPLALVLSFSTFGTPFRLWSCLCACFLFLPRV